MKKTVINLTVVIFLVCFAVLPVRAEVEFIQIQHLIESLVIGFDIGDVNNDGANEIVISDYSNSEILVYDAQYELSYSIPFTEAPRVVLVSDIDDDLRNELIVGTTTGDSPGHAYIGEVEETGDFSVEWTSPSYYLRFAQEFAVGDLDFDGYKELVMGLSWWDRKLVSYEYDGSTYSLIFTDSIGSDTDSAYIAGDMLIVGTGCYSDYGMRVYRDYTLEFSDLSDACTAACAGDVNGDGTLEIIRGIGTRCSEQPYSPRPVFSIYDETYSKVYTSPELTQNNGARIYVASGELIAGGGEEIAVGIWSDYTQIEPNSIKIFQYNGSSYEEVWNEDLSDLMEDVNHLKISDLDEDGQNELFVSTRSGGLYVYVNCADADKDGYADEVCGGTDCDDTDPAINPESEEICTDGIDNDCDGLVDGDDDDCPCIDMDGDGYGDPASSECVFPQWDCDDTDPYANPGAQEGPQGSPYCSDGKDNDCDGLVDSYDPDCGPGCTDMDGDGFAIEGGECGLVDCDDTDPFVYPGYIESTGMGNCADGKDNDCDGLMDAADLDCAPPCSVFITPISQSTIVFCLIPAMALVFLSRRFLRRGKSKNVS